MSRIDSPITRRSFLRIAALSALGLALPRVALAHCDDACRDVYESFDRPPRDFGRIISWQQTVRLAPDPTAKAVGYASRDEVIPLYAQLPGVAPWPSNPIWYMTSGGFIHSGYVQPVETTPNPEVIEHVEAPGFWAEVCLPFATGQWSPGPARSARRLYYETVYRVVNAQKAEDESWWYQLEQGVTYNTRASGSPPTRCAG